MKTAVVRDALQLTDMVQSILKPRQLPPTQWPVSRALILPPGSNYVYQRTLKDPANVNHCIEYLLYTGDKGDKVIRAKTQLLGQMMHEPAYDQLRTKEQLGYIVFSGVGSLSTRYGFLFLLQSERLPQYLEARVDAFIELFAQQLADMSDEDFEAHKRSLVVRLLKKPENLDVETNRHWTQISTEYYDFAIAQQDADHVKGLTKAEMIDFYAQFIQTKSTHRAKLVVQLFAQGSAESREKVAGLMECLSDEADETRDAVSSALMNPDLRNDTAALSAVLDGLKVSGEKAKAVIAASKDPATGPRTNGSKDQGVENSQPANGIQPSLITNVREFKNSLVASSGARHDKDVSEYQDIDCKL